MPQGKRVLITGGAGFIGSHLADELLRHGYNVRALDNLSLKSTAARAATATAGCAAPAGPTT